MNLDHLKGEELFSALRANKTSLIQTKKASLKYTDSVIATTVVTPREVKTSSTKESSTSNEDSPLAAKDTLDVTVVCNTAWLCDSHMDVLTDTAYDESIAKRGNSIPHIADHITSSTAHVGDVTKVYTKTISLRDLGMEAEGSTTALLMDSTVRKDYNEDVYKFYVNGKINQHSIGLSYGDILMAINSQHENDKTELAVWDEYYPKVINKDVVDKRGYFWVVPKVDIRENSCVLFGANPLTPTLSAKAEQQDSSLGNTEEPTVINQSIGNTMTLEEAQGKIISLTQELAEAKAATAVIKLEAKALEQKRVTDILKAANAFGSDAKIQKAAMSFIEKDSSVDTAITSFEVIKEALQDATHVDTSGAAATASVEKTDVGTKNDFTSVLDKALDQVEKSVNHFAGVK